MDDSKRETIKAAKDIVNKESTELASLRLLEEIRDVLKEMAEKNKRWFEK